MAGDAVQFTSIDENEHRRLLAVADDCFGADAFIANVIWQKNFSPKNTAQHFSEDHDFLTVHARDAAIWRPVLLDRTAEQDAAYSNPDDDPRGVWTSSDMSARNFYGEGIYTVRTPAGRLIAGPPPGTYWRVSAGKLAELDSDGRIWWGSRQDGVPRLKRFLADVMQGRVPQTLWLHKDVGHTQDGKRALLAMMTFTVGEAVFNTIKPVPLIERCIAIANGTVTLDYFAGSGTTAHAVINLNRADGGQRKFILVEQGEYFDTVTLPRVAKVMASPGWKDGRPQADVQHDASAADEPEAHWSRRTLPIVQVLRLERYEDSLDALALPAQADAANPGQAELTGLDSVLRYLADSTAPDNPVRLSTARLATPFDYRLPTVWDGRAVERPVDLLHTALLLLGLHLVRLRRLQREATADAPLPCPASTCIVLLAEVRPHRPGQPAASVPLELLVLRDHDTETMDVAQRGAAAQAECDWLQQTVPAVLGRTLASYARIRHNRDLALTGEGERPESIDTALAQAMWSRDPAFAAPGA